MLTSVLQDERYDHTFLITILEVSHERRTGLITGRNWDGSTGGGKQDQEIYANRLGMCWDGFFCACVRHGLSEAVLVIGTSLPQSRRWTWWVQLLQPSAIAVYTICKVNRGSSPIDGIRFSRTNPAPNESNEKQNPDTEQDRFQQDVNPSMIVNHE
jgi:hypothetical protein